MPKALTLVATNTPQSWRPGFTAGNHHIELACGRRTSSYYTQHGEFPLCVISSYRSSKELRGLSTFIPNDRPHRYPTSVARRFIRSQLLSESPDLLAQLRLSRVHACTHGQSWHLPKLARSYAPAAVVVLVAALIGPLPRV